MDLDEYQKRSNETDRLGAFSKSLEPHLLGLVTEVGDLAESWRRYEKDHEKYLGFEPRVREELGDILWYVAAIARRTGVSLDDIAQENLIRNQERWLPTITRGKPQLYDTGFSASEQLPRKFRIEFVSYDESDGTPHVKMFLRQPSPGTSVGDPLSDRAYEEDGYRFHDALHLAYVACLGWSPVIRSLMGKRRKSNTTINKIEDGARAVVIEEGLSAHLFDQAREWSWFTGAETVDPDILKYARTMVAGLEVKSRSKPEWEHCILTGFEVWRHLRDNNGGLVEGDLTKRTLTYAVKPKSRLAKKA
jgi:NTP pyrophosphatase (non-canonical NTP hydrolase)